MAATKLEHLGALAALTSAALALPGIQAEAATTLADPQINLLYGHYQESGDRMHVDVYHQDFSVPFSEQLELAFSIDRDTYAGASPAFSIPESMANQPKYQLQTNGSSNNQTTPTDVAYVITGASTGTHHDHTHGFNEMLTIFGLDEYQVFTDGRTANAVKIAAITDPQKTDLLNTLNSATATDKSIWDSSVARDESIYATQLSSINNDYTIRLNTINSNYTSQLNSIDAQLPALYNQFLSDQASLANNETTALNNYQNSNPRPSDPVSVNSGGLIDFENLAQSAYYGIANDNPSVGGACTGSGATDCYFQNGMAIGRVDDSSTTAHLHRYALSFDPDTFAVTNWAMEYHADSPGIYIRAVNGNAFSLNSMDFNSQLSGNNPGHASNDYWEILGFSTAFNSGLSSGNGANYTSRIAYETINNGFNGTVTLSSNASVTNCTASMTSCALNSAFNNVNAIWIHYHGYPSTPTDGKIFNLILDNVAFSPVSVPTNAQSSWDSAYNAYKSSLNSNYQSQLTALTNAYNSQVAAISSSNSAAINTLNADKNNKITILNADKTASISALNASEAAALASLKATYDSQVAALNDSYNQNLSTINAQEAELSKTLLIQTYQTLLNSMTPANPSPVQRYQQQPLETRTQPTFNGKYYIKDTSIGFSAGMSEEPDFISNFGSINLSQELNNKLTTVSVGYNGSFNHITRNTGHQHADPAANDPNYPTLNGNSNYHSFSLALSQVLAKNTLAQSTINFSQQTGYLSNPYKFVYIRGEVTAAEYYYLSQQGQSPIDWKSITNLEMVGTELFREVRPDQRNQWSFSNRINQHIPALDASVHFDYRFFTDDWGINSHTFDLKWYQELPLGFTVTPSIRYYSQSQAVFFAPYFLAPRADGHYSSDYRLADYGAISAGLSVAKQFGKGIKLNAGIDYYNRQSNLKLGGGNDSAYADYNYFMLHAGVNINLSAPSGHDTESGGAHKHQHGKPLPAGVMFGHMLDKAGDMMIGYRYMYANQTGSMLHGSTPVSDVSLLNANWCAPASCESRPGEMSMNMHMLEFMYAPTDWLNLMAMPQLMDMKMSMLQIPGANAIEHTGHSSGGLGDTQLSALFKLFDFAGHHLHLGIGASAPTGEVGLTIDGLKNSSLQDYGMQTGSGTWDFKPNLTYTGHFDEWSWGAQLSGTKRLQNRNQSGYVLGDAFQATAWGSYKLVDWVSTSIRGVYLESGKIKGQHNNGQILTSSVDYADNYGGRFFDIGFGLNTAVTDGLLAGQNFSLEWLQPVMTNYNGYQLDREGSLNATWSFGF